MGRKVDVGDGKYLDTETGEFVGGGIISTQQTRPTPTSPTYRNNNTSYTRIPPSNQTYSSNSSNSSGSSVGKSIFAIIFVIIIIWVIAKSCSPTSSTNSPSNNTSTTSSPANISIPNNTTTIRQNEYANKKLININIPNSVTNIESGAFRNNNLSSITIPNSVRRIGRDAFDGNQITSVTIGANVNLGYDYKDGRIGILGPDTKFNTAYNNNNSRAGTYTRVNTYSTEWRFNGQIIRSQPVQQQSIATSAIQLTENKYTTSDFTSSIRSRTFSFSTTSGRKYNIWLEDYDSNSSYVDAVITARYYDGTNIFTSIDVASPSSFTANRSSVINLIVTPRVSGSAGNFRVGYN